MCPRDQAAVRDGSLLCVPRPRKSRSTISAKDDADGSGSELSSSEGDADGSGSGSDDEYQNNYRLGPLPSTRQPPPLPRVAPLPSTRQPPSSPRATGSTRCHLAQCTRASRRGHRHVTAAAPNSRAHDRAPPTRRTRASLHLASRPRPPATPTGRRHNNKEGAARWSLSLGTRGGGQSPPSCPARSCGLKGPSPRGPSRRTFRSAFRSGSAAQYISYAPHNTCKYHHSTHQPRAYHASCSTGSSHQYLITSAYSRSRAQPPSHSLRR